MDPQLDPRLVERADGLRHTLLRFIPRRTGTLSLIPIRSYAPCAMFCGTDRDIYISASQVAAESYRVASVYKPPPSRDARRTYGGRKPNFSRVEHPEYHPWPACMRWKRPLPVNPKHVHDSTLAALEQDEDDLETLKSRYKWLQISRMKLLCDLVFVCEF